MPIRLFLALAALCLGLPSVTAAAKKPNIVVILVDDMGFSDLGCYGSEIPTPNLDKLAANGLRFKQFYNTARCCPTRAALLTGLYSHQAGVGHMTDDRGAQAPGYRGRLNDQCVTIAEVLQPAGYFTAMTGKWHVGQGFGVVPWKRGFDRSLNAPAGGFYFADNPKAELFLNGEALKPNDKRLPKDWYTTDLWTEFGIRFIDEARAAKKPFFLYLAHNAPHFPIQAREADVARFRGRYKDGWDKLRDDRLRRQVEMGLIPKEWNLTPRPGDMPAWSSLTTAQQDRYDHIMAIFAAALFSVDRAVGNLVAALTERGELDNTLIFFMTDNGGNAESGIPGKLTDNKKEGKHTIAWTGKCWATLENTPFRLYKHFEHEGGIASPLIAHWPAGISAKGEWRDQVGHLIDIMPTCAAAAGATYPTEFHGHAIQPMEGKSLLPAFANQPLERGWLYWEHEGHRAARDGQWKLVAEKGQPWELFDMAADRTEMHNLASAQPERVKDMAAHWDAWAKRCHVLDGPKKAKKKK